MSADSQETGGESLTFYLSLTSAPSAPRVPITLPKSTSSPTTASDLRRLASEATTVPLSSMKLIFRGRVIAEKSEGDVVNEFKLENECVIHVMGKPANSSNGAGPTFAGAAGSAASTTPMPAGASVSMPTGGVAPPAAGGASNASPLASALITLRSSNTAEVYRTALTTADKLLGNIVSHPMEEKYRSVKKANPAFNRRLGGVNGGEALLLASGFAVEVGEGGAEAYVLRPSADAWPRLVAAGQEVKRALEEANVSNQGSTFLTAPGTGAGAGVGAGAGGLPNLLPGGLGGPGGMDMMQSMLSNPDMLQNMMNNPMVQQMMRNDPRFANNPMLQQSIEALQSNPDMIRQFSQLMGDPSMRENVSRMMQQQQPGGGAGSGPVSNGPDEMRRQMEAFQRMSQRFGGTGGTFNAAAGGSGTAPSGQSGATSSGDGAGEAGGNGDDSEMTEEEMIAEAIARSLREQ